MKCPKCTRRLRNAYAYSGTSTTQVPWLYCDRCEIMISPDHYEREIQEFFQIHITTNEFKVRIAFDDITHVFEIRGPKEIEIFPIYLHLKTFLNYSWKTQLRQFIVPIIEGVTNLQKLQDLAEA